MTFFLYSKNVLTGNFLTGKFVFGLMAVIFLTLSFYALYKFRILIVDNNKIISYYMFRFQKKIIYLNQIQELDLENFMAFRSTAFRRIIITSNNNILKISDLEFDNFEKLIDQILDKKTKDKKLKIDKLKAQWNLSFLNIDIYLLYALIIFLVYACIWHSESLVLTLPLLICSSLFLYQATKRKSEYKKILNTGNHKF